MQFASFIHACIQRFIVYTSLSWQMTNDGGGLRCLTLDEIIKLFGRVVQLNVGSRESGDLSLLVPVAAVTYSQLKVFKVFIILH
jgi:hypothetical protein